MTVLVDSEDRVVTVEELFRNGIDMRCAKSGYDGCCNACNRKHHTTAYKRQGVCCGNAKQLRLDVSRTEKRARDTDSHSGPEESEILCPNRSSWRSTFERVCKMDLEGIVAKRKTSRYIATEKPSPEFDRTQESGIQSGGRSGGTVRAPLTAFTRSLGFQRNRSPSPQPSLSPFQTQSLLR